MIKFCARILVVSLILLVTVVAPVFASTSTIQMPSSGWDPLGRNVSSWCRLGQRLVIPDRTITLIGYAVWRVGNPTGDVTFSIYNTDPSQFELIASVLWGDASELPPVGQGGYQVAELAMPQRLNQEVIICVEYYGGNATDYCAGGYYTGDKIAGETYVNYYHYGQWHDVGEAEEGSYCYTYVDEGGSTNPDGDTNWGPIICTIVGGVIGLVFLIRHFVRRRRRNSA